MKRLSFILTLSFFLFSCKNEKDYKLAEGKVQTKRPNIIWLMAEDMSTDLECYDMPNVKTPNLNKMAAQGIRFDNAFVTNSICSPSRSAMMVGTHQVKTNTHHHRSNRNVPLDPQFKPFTKLLRDAGYTTILGHHGVMKKGRKIDVNFKHKPLGEWDGKTKFGLFDKYDTFEKTDEPFFAQIQLVVTHRGDWWTDVRNQSKHPVDTETLEMPPYMSDHPAIRLDWAKYLDQIEYMDNEVGMIFKELEEKGMADNTIVIFIGDNGRCNIRGKGYLLDPGLRIPLIMYYPNKFKAGEVRKEVVSATDITASIIDFAGIEVPGYMTGQPIFSKDFEREYVYGARDLWDEIEEDSKALVSGDWSYIYNAKPEVPYDAHQAYLEFYRPAVHIMRRLYQEGKLTESQKLFFEPSKPIEQLFNMKEDPHQLNNLIDNPEYESVLNKLRKEKQQFDKLMKPVSDVYEPVKMTSPKALVWMKKELPNDYKRMLAGEEIGFKRIMNLYKEHIKKNKK
ncbi:sulfatase-like hydrolase/transferase [Flavivirga abyssicola]|uniref:sulfatase-like hydrolase/transferase n=1 Tax=Flavivirga abyssicola TaxID=3063533 RepID=UPI0026DF8556|nr:sulfatase-like hydrolase/transferase [Flavivirga sp. MEBiC07777]WVK13752.1 sulfatase-like hydrolase/transferase [Flavivirga sp. MEBiC07777]